MCSKCVESEIDIKILVHSFEIRSTACLIASINAKCMMNLGGLMSIFNVAAVDIEYIIPIFETSLILLEKNGKP